MKVPTHKNPHFLTQGQCDNIINPFLHLKVYESRLQAFNANDCFLYFSLTYVLVSTIFVLLFGLYISHLKRLSIERNANELKCQLAITTQEKCYLISKIKKPIHHDNAKAKTNT